MRTSKPISTISYNSEEFIKQKIEYWRMLGIIEFGAWIKHKAENDEKKDHFHILLRPAKLIQTMDLENDSLELDPLNPDKPLKMIGFRVSVEADWLLYCLHDKSYLAEKGLIRDFHYDITDISSTDNDTLTDIITNSLESRKGKIEWRIVECIDLGMSWGDIVRSGLIPIRFMGGAKIMYQAITGQSI